MDVFTRFKACSACSWSFSIQKLVRTADPGEGMDAIMPCSKAASRTALSPVSTVALMTLYSCFSTWGGIRSRISRILALASLLNWADANNFSIRHSLTSAGRSGAPSIRRSTISRTSQSSMVPKTRPISCARIAISFGVGLTNIIQAHTSLGVRARRSPCPPGGSAPASLGPVPRSARTSP